MVDRLQRKFMLITTTTLFLVLFIFVITLNLINIININRQSDSLLSLIQEYDGNLPREFKDVKPKNIYDFYGFINKNDYNKRVPIHNIYFSVKIFYDGSILVNIRNNDSIDILDAKSLAENVINSNRYKGYKGFYKFLVSDMYGYKLVSFVDSSNDISKSVDFAIISMFV
ncbi:Putative sensory transduction histidine kinase, partial [Candidatus Arthromitus sp. SFB-3]